MSNVLLLKELKELTGRKDKLEFIKTHKNNSEFLFLLKVLLDSTIILGVKTISPEWYLHSVGKLGSKSKEFSQLVEYLVSHNRSSNTMTMIKDFLKTCNVQESEIYAGILTKAYKIGVTGTSVNSVLDTPIVVDFTLEKAEPFREDLVDFGVKFVLGEEKYDGVRCAVFYEDGKITALTYNKKVVELKTIGAAIKKVCKNLGVTSIMFDCELMSNSTRVSTSGLVNRLIKSPEKHTDEDLYLKVFHYMTIAEFKARKDPKTLHEVAITLGKWIANGFENDKVKFSVFYFLRDMEEIDALFKDVRTKGGEGIMVKIPTAKYEWKRSKNWLKLKSIYSTTLRVVDIYKAGEDTKYKGLVGGLICETKEGFQVAVGGGLSDNDRIVYLDRSRIVGKLVEIIFTDINFAEDGTMFLDFPRMKEVRIDKHEPDTIEQMVGEIPKYKNI